MVCVKANVSVSERQKQVDVLGDPGDQRFCLEDHLISVAALNGVSINQAANSQLVRIWR